MQVILQKDVKHLGRRGDVVNVKNGYFSNYLLPNKLAETATPGRLKIAQVRLESRVKKLEEIKGQADELKSQLDGKEITISEKVTDKNTLYAAVSSKEIIALVAKEFKIELTENAVDLPDHIKELGDYNVKLNLAEGVVAVIVLHVVAA